MKLVDVKSKTYINFSKESNYKDPKSKVENYVRISKHKNIFLKGYNPNWSDKAFFLKNAKNTVPLTYLIRDLNGKEILGTLCKKDI